MEKAFLENNTIWYAFYKKFATLSDFEEIQKTRLFLPKKIKFPSFWEILLFQSHSMANVQQFGEKNSRSEMWTNIVNAIGKHRVKINVQFERKIFLPYFINMAKNNM